MKLIKLGAVVLTQSPLDWMGNKSRIHPAIVAERRASISLLCLARTLHYRLRIRRNHGPTNSPTR
jgi:hypothetical protein